LTREPGRPRPRLRPTSRRHRRDGGLAGTTCKHYLGRRPFPDGRSESLTNPGYRRGPPRPAGQTSPRPTKSPAGAGPSQGTFVVPSDSSVRNVDEGFLRSMAGARLPTGAQVKKPRRSGVWCGRHQASSALRNVSSSCRKSVRRWMHSTMPAPPRTATLAVKQAWRRTTSRPYVRVAQAARLTT
jgi:hypothetical protein